MVNKKFIDVNAERNDVVVVVNTKVYPIDLIYNAAYSILSRAYVILDGDPTKEVFVYLKPRTFKGTLEDLGNMFFDELTNSAFYAVQLVRNKEIRDALIEETFVDAEGDEEDIVELWEKKFSKEEDLK